VEDFYRLLDIEEQWSCEKIAAHLTGLNRDLRGRTRHRDSAVREKALSRIELIGQASAHLTEEVERMAYDKALAGQRAEEELKQPLADINLYQHFQLAMNAREEDIEALLDAAAAKLEGQSTLGEAETREYGLVVLARRILLDAEQRAEYDDLLRAKLAYEKEMEAVKPMPLEVNDVVVEDRSALDQALVAHPYRGLFLLQDGEIEAWLRWSQGQRQRADWVRDIAKRSYESETPFMEYGELLRLINGNHPLEVFRPGQGPKDGAVAVLRNPKDIPPAADANWGVFVAQYEYVVDWLRHVGDEKLLQKLWQLPETHNQNISLERLLFTIDPALASPAVIVEGVSGQTIDFGTVSAWENPSQSFTIKQSGRGYLYGRLDTSAEWLILDADEFVGRETMVTVSADRGKMVSGEHNAGEVFIKAMDGRMPTFSIEVSAHQHTVTDSVKTGFKKLFGRK